MLDAEVGGKDISKNQVRKTRCFKARLSKRDLDAMTSLFVKKPKWEESAMMRELLRSKPGTELIHWHSFPTATRILRY